MIHPLIYSFISNGLLTKWKTQTLNTFLTSSLLLPRMDFKALLFSGPGIRESSVFEVVDYFNTNYEVTASPDVCFTIFRMFLVTLLKKHSLDVYLKRKNLLNLCKIFCYFSSNTVKKTTLNLKIKIFVVSYRKKHQPRKHCEFSPPLLRV